MPKLPKVIACYDTLVCQPQMFMLVTKAETRGDVTMSLWGCNNGEYQLFRKSVIPRRYFDSANGIKNHPRFILAEFTDIFSDLIPLDLQDGLKMVVNNENFEEMLPFNYKIGMDQRKEIKFIGNSAINSPVAKYLAKQLETAVPTYPNKI